MKKYKKETRYVSVLTVHIPAASALIDMMRYDRCCPMTEADSAKIERLMSRRGEPMDHVVRLYRYSANPDFATKDRWASFSCVVLDERNPDESPPTDADVRNMLKLEGLA